MDDTVLPTAVELLWDRQAPGSRGPRPTRRLGEIVAAAVEIADTEGLDAVSMARVAKALGFTTMALYRYVPSKEVLLQLMWNAASEEFTDIDLDGSTWREQLRSWTLLQREGLERHLWLTQMPIGSPPVSPHAFAWLEKGFAALRDTGLPVDEQFRSLALLSASALADARLSREIREAAVVAAAEGTAIDFGQMVRTLADQETYPTLYQLAADGEFDMPEGASDIDFFVDDVELILDGVAARIERFSGAH